MCCNTINKYQINIFSGCSEAKMAKQRLFERLADSDRAEFLEKKAYDAEIVELVQRVSDARMAD